jgi:hypothetical protein
LKKWRGRRRWSCCKSRKRQQHSPMNVYDWYWSLKRRECELYKAGWLESSRAQNKTGPFWAAGPWKWSSPIYMRQATAGPADWLAGWPVLSRLSPLVSLYNSLGFSFLTLVTRWPADAVTYGRSCRCCCCCCCRLAQHLTLFREEKKRNGSLSVYRLPYPNSLESLPNQLIGKNGEL